MRYRWIQDPKTGKLIPADEYTRESNDPGYYVMPDLGPYKSIVTGEEISSRSRHREHLKRHDLVEVGNEDIRNPTKAKDDREARKKAIADVLSGYGI